MMHINNAFSFKRIYLNAEPTCAAHIQRKGFQKLKEF